MTRAAGATRFAGLLSCALMLATASARASSAEELVREARAHEEAHEDDLALRRYAEALTLDPTLGEAYLGLAALRLHLGDPREAERVYEAALARVPALAIARLGRARARRALGTPVEADADLEVYVAITDDPAGARELAGWYEEEGRPLAQLGVWRRILTFAERRADRALRKEARLTVHALELIVGAADPVRAPGGTIGGRDSGATSVRRGMARMEARR